MIVGMLLFGGAAVAKVAQDSAGAQLLLENVVGMSCRAPAALLLGHKCVIFLVSSYILHTCGLRQSQSCLKILWANLHSNSNLVAVWKCAVLWPQQAPCILLLGGGRRSARKAWLSVSGILPFHFSPPRSGHLTPHLGVHPLQMCWCDLRLHVSSDCQWCVQLQSCSQFTIDQA